MNKSLYDILEIDSTASYAEIKEAYRKLCMKYHPDKGEENVEKFHEVNTAYVILSDPVKRSQYDQTGKVDMKPLNREKRIYETLMFVFDTYLTKTNLDFKSINLKQAIIQAIKTNINQNLNSVLKHAKKQIENLEIIQNNFKLKKVDEKDSIYEITDLMLIKMKAEYKLIEDEIDIHNEVIKIVKKYNYQTVLKLTQGEE